MKRITTNLLAVSLLCLLSVGALAQGKDLREHVTFSENLLVNNTLVKKGEYLVKYNAQTGQVSFMDGRKMVAQAKASVKVNDKKAESDVLYTKMTPAGEKLTGMKLGGQHEEITISDVSADLENDDLTDYQLMCLPWF